MKQSAADSVAVIDLPMGRVRIIATAENLLAIEYVSAKVNLKVATTPITRAAVSQLRRYLKNPDFKFNLPVQTEGTDFQNEVWRALRRISPGKVITYGDLAAKLGSGARAVGNACRHNPVSIVIPCHRVIAANGLGGYGGYTQGRVLDRKRWLLSHEGLEL